MKHEEAIISLYNSIRNDLYRYSHEVDNAKQNIEELLKSGFISDKIISRRYKGIREASKRLEEMEDVLENMQRVISSSSEGYFRDKKRLKSLNKLYDRMKPLYHRMQDDFSMAIEVREFVVPYLVKMNKQQHEEESRKPKPEDPEWVIKERKRAEAHALDKIATEGRVKIILEKEKTKSDKEAEERRLEHDLEIQNRKNESNERMKETDLMLKQKELEVAKMLLEVEQLKASQDQASKERLDRLRSMLE